MKQAVAFLNFVKAPKNSKRYDVKGSFRLEFSPPTLTSEIVVELPAFLRGQKDIRLFAHLLIYLHTYWPTYLRMYFTHLRLSLWLYYRLRPASKSKTVKLLLQAFAVGPYPESY